MNWQRDTNPPLHNICKLNLLFNLPPEIPVPPYFFIFLNFYHIYTKFLFFFPFSPSSETPSFPCHPSILRPFLSVPHLSLFRAFSSLTAGTLFVPHSPLHTPLRCSPQLSTTEKASQNGKTDAWWREEPGNAEGVSQLWELPNTEMVVSSKFVAPKLLLGRCAFVDWECYV